MHTPVSQTGADKTGDSENSPTVSSIAPHVQTTQSQAVGSQTSVSTIQSSSAPRTTAQTTDSQADVNTFRYFRVQYQTIPCVSDYHALAIVKAR